jgi:Icc-related predicted phosphoesterase
MKIHFCSDLHLDIKHLDVTTEGDVLILAGDIMELESVRRWPRDSDWDQPSKSEHKLKAKRYWDFLDQVTNRYGQVVYVMGNHEYYGGRWDQIQHTFKGLEDVYVNLNCLERDLVEIEGVKFLGCTLWTSMNRGNPLTVEVAKSYMNDYRNIKMNPKDGYGKLQPRHTIEDHKASHQWLRENVGEGDVVVTHHLPSWWSIPYFYRTRTDESNYFYFSDLHDVLCHDPKLWIHGHTHEGCDYLIDGPNSARVLCNPRGYWGYEHSAYNFEVKEVIL